MQWGKDFYLQPLKSEKQVAEELKSLGAHVIIGSHPHVLQNHCFAENHVVAYSLGNFLYPFYVPGGNVSEPTTFILRLFIQNSCKISRHPNLRLEKGLQLPMKFVLGRCDTFGFCQIFWIFQARLLWPGMAIWKDIPKCYCNRSNDIIIRFPFIISSLKLFVEFSWAIRRGKYFW